MGWTLAYGQGNKNGKVERCYPEAISRIWKMTASAGERIRRDGSATETSGMLVL